MASQESSAEDTNLKDYIYLNTSIGTIVNDVSAVKK